MRFKTKNCFLIIIGILSFGLTSCDIFLNFSELTNSNTNQTSKSYDSFTSNTSEKGNVSESNDISYNSNTSVSNLTSSNSSVKNTSSISSQYQESINSNQQTERHSVDFDTDGGSYIRSQSILHGEKILNPGTPVKTGYYFQGWFYKEQEWSFENYVVTENMTLAAKWVLAYTFTVDNHETNGFYTLYISGNVANLTLDSDVFSKPEINFDENATNQNHFTMDLVKEIHINGFKEVKYLPALYILEDVYFDETLTKLSNNIFYSAGEGVAKLNVHFKGDLPEYDNQTFRRNGGGNLYIYHGPEGKGFDSAFINGCPVRLENESITIPDISVSQYSLLSAIKARELAKDIFENAVRDNSYEFMLYPISDLKTYIEIKNLALELTKQCQNDSEKASVLYNWVIDNIAYDAGYTIASMNSVFTDKKAVCCGYASILHDLLASVGIMSTYTSGIANYSNLSLKTILNPNGLDLSSHAWLQVYINNNVVVMDPTWGSKTFISSSYYGEASYDMSDDEIASRYITLDTDIISIVPEGFDYTLYDFIVYPYEDNGELAIYVIDHGHVVGGVSETRNYMYYATMKANTDERHVYIGDDCPIRSVYRNCLLKEYNMDSLSYWYYCLSNGHSIQFIDLMKYIAIEENYFNRSFTIDINSYLGDDFIVDGDNLYRKTGSNTLTLAISFSNESNIAIPNTVGNFMITSIGENAFYENKNIESLFIPENVEEISTHAFGYCENLKTITFSEGLKNIGAFAFTGCDSLQNIVLPNSLNKIMTLAFSYCRFLETVSIGKNLNLLDQSVFINSPNIKEYIVNQENEYFSSFDGTLYSKDKDILYCYPVGKDATSFTVPSSVKRIYFSAFYYAENLQSINLNEGLESIDGGAFLRTSISEIIIPSTVNFIGSQAFAFCSNLISVDIKSNNIRFESYVFEETPFYDNIRSYDNGFLYAGNVLLRCISNESYLKIKDGTTTIATNTFIDCENLETAYLPDSLTRVNSYAFNGCQNLKTIIMHNSIKAVDSYAFQACTNLNTIYFIGTPEEFAAIYVDNEFSRNTTFINANVIYVNEIPDIYK